MAIRIKNIGAGFAFSLAALSLAFSGMFAGRASAQTTDQQLLCFSGVTTGGFNGTCELTENGATLNTTDNDEDPNNAYAGVYYEQAGLGGTLLSSPKALSFSYTGTGATGGSPRLSIPIDENNDGTTENYAYVDTMGCNNGDANTGTLDVVNDETCTISYAGATYDNWAAFASANPDFRFARDAVIFVIVDQPGVFTLNNVRIGTQGPASLKEQCKKDGWRTMQSFEGASFKNQGSCVSYYASNLSSKVNRLQAAAQKQLKDQQ